MPNYMLLFYADEADAAENARRNAERPEWMERAQELAARGVLIANGRLHGSEAATTVRVVDGETELSDGPFAVTREILGGYWLVDVPDLDDAVKIAASLPLARYGKVEVRPQMSEEEALRIAEEAAAVTGA